MSFITQDDASVIETKEECNLIANSKEAVIYCMKEKPFFKLQTIGLS